MATNNNSFTFSPATIANGSPSSSSTSFNSASVWDNAIYQTNSSLRFTGTVVVQFIISSNAVSDTITSLLSRYTPRSFVTNFPMIALKHIIRTYYGEMNQIFKLLTYKKYTSWTKNRGILKMRSAVATDISIVTLAAFIDILFRSRAGYIIQMKWSRSWIIS